MTQDTENKLAEKTVLVVFPSIFSSNKIDSLQENISHILKIKKQSFTLMRRNESLIIVETTDPVLVSATIGSLFGIERIAIAKEVTNQFETVLSAITTTYANLLLAGEKFYVKVEGRTPDYLAKDLEVAATGSMIEKAASLQARPGSETDHDKLLYTFITKTHAYVCVFIDKGLGGIPYYSQHESILCCMYDELSAITCLQCIKMGFATRMVVCYSDDSDLLRMAKMINRILQSMVEEKITFYFCKIRKTRDPLTKILVVTNLLAAIAKSKKIKRIGLPILPFVLPTQFVESTARDIFKKGLTPWLPLSGMDSSIFENSKQLGLEKFLASLEDTCRLKFSKINTSKKKVAEIASSAIKNLKSITITVGPKNVYDMIDSLRTNH